MTDHRQIKAARILLDWDQADLRKAAGLGLGTIQRLETAAGLAAARHGNVAKVRAVLEAAGIEFLDASGGKGPGVRLRKG